MACPWTLWIVVEPDDPRMASTKVGSRSVRPWVTLAPAAPRVVNGFCRLTMLGREEGQRSAGHVPQCDPVHIELLQARDCSPATRTIANDERNFRVRIQMAQDQSEVIFIGEERKRGHPVLAIGLQSPALVA